MDIDTAKQYDLYFRLQELSTDHEVAAKIYELVRAEAQLKEAKVLIMSGASPSEGIAAAKRFLRSLK